MKIFTWIFYLLPLYTAAQNSSLVLQNEQPCYIVPTLVEDKYMLADEGGRIIDSIARGNLRMSRGHRYYSDLDSLGVLHYYNCRGREFFSIDYKADHSLNPITNTNFLVIYDGKRKITKVQHSLFPNQSIAMEDEGCKVYGWKGNIVIFHQDRVSILDYMLDTLAVHSEVKSLNVEKNFLGIKGFSADQYRIYSDYLSEKLCFVTEMPDKTDLVYDSSFIYCFDGQELHKKVSHNFDKVTVMSDSIILGYFDYAPNLQYNDGPRGFTSIFDSDLIEILRVKGLVYSVRFNQGGGENHLILTFNNAYLLRENHDNYELLKKLPNYIDNTWDLDLNGNLVVNERTVLLPTGDTVATFELTLGTMQVSKAFNLSTNDWPIAFDYCDDGTVVYDREYKIIEEFRDRGIKQPLHEDIGLIVSASMLWGDDPNYNEFLHLPNGEIIHKAKRIKILGTEAGKHLCETEDGIISVDPATLEVSEARFFTTRLRASKLINRIDCESLVSRDLSKDEHFSNCQQLCYDIRNADSSVDSFTYVYPALKRGDKTNRDTPRDFARKLAVYDDYGENILPPGFVPGFSDRFFRDKSFITRSFFGVASLTNFDSVGLVAHDGSWLHRPVRGRFYRSGEYVLLYDLSELTVKVYDGDGTLRLSGLSSFNNFGLSSSSFSGINAFTNQSLVGRFVASPSWKRWWFCLLAMNNEQLVDFLTREIKIRQQYDLVASDLRTVLYKNVTKVYEIHGYTWVQFKNDESDYVTAIDPRDEEILRVDGLFQRLSRKEFIISNNMGFEVFTEEGFSLLSVSDVDSIRVVHIGMNLLDVVIKGVRKFGVIANEGGNRKFIETSISPDGYEVIPFKSDRFFILRRESSDTYYRLIDKLTGIEYSCPYALSSSRRVLNGTFAAPECILVIDSDGSEFFFRPRDQKEFRL